MDFIIILPAHQGNTVIIVVIDRFSKAAHFGSLPTHFSTWKATELFINIISKLIGYLVSSQTETPFFLANFGKHSSNSTILSSI